MYGGYSVKERFGSPDCMFAAQASSLSSLERRMRLQRSEPPCFSSKDIRNKHPGFLHVIPIGLAEVPDVLGFFHFRSDCQKNHGNESQYQTARGDVL
jgi:hypothetical protein